ncbi:GL16777 [Drosophila persimilis]|uniref:GL16777 n=1 Tax=Drosophila persimilis TaxID=7234 RepID=B4GIC9_DROPE|nr:GL16777 [Drosophila persimilis]
MEEANITGVDCQCPHKRANSLQSFTANRLQMPWWCPLLENLFMLLLMKLLQM